jgi:hypothetical protein
LADWLRNQGIKDTLSYDRIIGCPHEEGLDYPIGRTCPQCPFWAGIDRFTHEPISAPVAKMSPNEVLAELAKDRTTHPLEALGSADAHRGVLVQPLLDVLDRCVTHPDTASEEEAQLFCYALYLLAKWRGTRAYPLVIRWLSLSDGASTGLSGDVSTQDGGRILAAVCDGDLEPIKGLVLNRDADEFSRGVAVAALALLAVWAEVPRDTILSYFAWLAREGLERRTNYVWGALAAESADIEALDVFPDLRRAYDEGFIDPQVIGRSELDDVEASPRGAVLERMKERHTSSPEGRAQRTVPLWQWEEVQEMLRSVTTCERPEASWTANQAAQWMSQGRKSPPIMPGCCWSRPSAVRSGRHPRLRGQPSRRPTSCCACRILRSGTASASPRGSGERASSHQSGSRAIAARKRSDAQLFGQSRTLRVKQLLGLAEHFTNVRRAHNTSRSRIGSSSRRRFFCDGLFEGPREPRPVRPDRCGYAGSNKAIRWKTIPSGKNRCWNRCR